MMLPSASRIIIIILLADGNSIFFFLVLVSFTLLILLTMIRNKFAISRLPTYPTNISVSLYYKT